MKSEMKKVSILGLCALLVSCLSFSQMEIEEATRIYGYTYDVVFNAVKKALFTLKADFTEIDEDNGMISARVQTVSSLTSAMFIGKATAGYLHYKFVFLEVDKGTLVKANLYYAYEDQTYKSYGREDVYNELWDAVETNLGL